MELIINDVVYSWVFDFTDEILGDVSHFIYTENDEIKHQFFVKKNQDDEIVYIMLEDKDNQLIAKKYFGGRV